jgi:hypothetical protein
MKRFCIISGLIVCSVLLSGCAGGPRLAGTWVMVENAGRDLGVPSAPRPGDSVKELTRSRFTFGVLDAEGAIGSGGGGEWYLRDGRYHEVVRFHHHPALVGETIAFACRIEGDRWLHSADFVAKGERFHIDEVWRRVKAGRSAEERRARH